MPKPVRVGLALGSGSARGWGHIGVLRALEREGIVPDVVVGTSIGAFVGAAYAHGELDRLEHWVRSLTRQEVLSLLDVSFRSGVIRGRKLMEVFQAQFVKCSFHELKRPFAAVATDLLTGREVWIREGDVAAAVRASIAMPGLVAPIERDGQLLVDGALVNPVPVSVCRALGADIVIAIDLGADMLARASRPVESDKPIEPMNDWKARFWEWVGFPASVRNKSGSEDDLPSMIAVIENSINIMQVRIARSRLAGDPADALVTPRLGHMGVLDYHRGAEAIDEGSAAVQRMLPMIRHVINP